MHKHRELGVHLDDKCRKQVETFRQGGVITERRPQWCRQLREIGANALARRMLEYLEGAPNKRKRGPEDDKCADDTCSICQEQGDQPSMGLPCGHSFHQECIIPWLKEKHTCPVCRKGARVVEHKGGAHAVAMEAPTTPTRPCASEGVFGCGGTVGDGGCSARMGALQSLFDFDTVLASSPRTQQQQQQTTMGADISESRQTYHFPYNETYSEWNIRSEPSCNGAEVGRIAQGDTFYVTEVRGEWLAVEHGHVKGWCRSTMDTLDEATGLTNRRTYLIPHDETQGPQSEPQGEQRMSEDHGDKQHDDLADLSEVGMTLDDVLGFLSSDPAENFSTMPG